MRKNVFTQVVGAEDFKELCGFTLVDVTDVEETTIFRFQNEHGVAVEMMQTEEELYLCEPFAVDPDGKVIE